MGLVSVFSYFVGYYFYHCVTVAGSVSTSSQHLSTDGDGLVGLQSSKRLTISKPFVLDCRGNHAHFTCCCVCVFLSSLLPCYLSQNFLWKTIVVVTYQKNRTQNSQVVPKIFCRWFISCFESITVLQFVLCSSTRLQFSVSQSLLEMLWDSG